MFPCTKFVNFKYLESFINDQFLSPRAKLMASTTKKSRRTAATTSSAANSDSENGSNRDNEDFEPNSWECTVCTFRNKYEAFKCLMCDTRKGTSTRKPRLNPTVVQQQTLVQKMAVEVEKQQKKNRNSSETRNSPDLFALPSSSGTPTTPTPTGGNLFPTADVAAARKLFVGQQQKATSTPAGKGPPPSVQKRRPIPFRDGLVVRSSAKKTVVTVDGRSFTITEFKPRISPRGRKKNTGSGHKEQKNKESSPNTVPKPLPN